MKVFRWIIGLAALAAAGTTGYSQRTPTVGYVYPAGGKQGTTFTAALSGQFMDGVTNVIISGEGVKATILEFAKPLGFRQRDTVRNRLESFKSGLAAAKKGENTIFVKNELNTNNSEVVRYDRKTVEAEMANLQYLLSNPKSPRAPNPQLAEDVKLRVTIAPDAKPGQREVRLLAASGLSNPLVFHVGQLPEYSKPWETSKVGANTLEPERYNQSRKSTVQSDIRITIPCVANGQIMPGTEDRFRFSARRGQKITIAVNARQLIPYLADAVPGWFQATIGLFDSKGKELQYADDFRFHPDPVLFYEMPADGDYVVEIKDSIYRGREDFVYRITIGELPFVTSIFPLGGVMGKQTELEIKGWNLTTNKITIDNTSQAPGISMLSFTNQEKVFNSTPFQVDNLSESMEKEPNNQNGTAQKISLPMVVNGRIDQPDDVDVYRFEGRTGTQIVAELFARRLNSPLDSELTLMDATGKQLAYNDDHEDKAAGLTTHHADSRIDFTLPSDGTYYLRVADTQHKGGSEFAYRLRVNTPKPDFELRVVPASLSVRSGSSIPVTVYALRKDGFNNEIALVLKDAPSGFRLYGTIPSGTNRARLTLNAPETPATKTYNLTVEGRAMVQGKQVTHTAVPAEDMMQAFYYHHLVPAQELEVAALMRPPSKDKKGYGQGQGAKGKKTAPK